MAIGVDVRDHSESGVEVVGLEMEMVPTPLKTHSKGYVPENRMV